jgi:hypothetical protein
MGLCKGRKIGYNLKTESRAKEKETECMIKVEDILSMEYLKKSDYTACHQGMRYRLEKSAGEDGTTQLLATVWPEPFNYISTPEEEKQRATFTFDADGVADAVAWMNDRLFHDKAKWDRARGNWEAYKWK